MKRLAGLLAIAAAAVLCGCPPSTTLPPLPDDAGVADYVGRRCNVDAECGALRCDTQRRQCICLSDTSCKPADPLAAPRYCNNYTGLCVDSISGCTADSACASGEFCDPSTRACRPLKTFCQACTADTECGGKDDNCVLDTGLGQKFCGRACTGAGDCPRGTTCQDKGASKQCWPDKTNSGQPATCKDFLGCTPDSLRACTQTADCGDASQRCDFAKGKCVAIAQVCPFGTTCDPRARLCVAVCSNDQDCGGGQFRCVNQVCELRNACTGDTECAANKVCTFPPGATEGQCTDFCAADSDCPIGQVCTAQNNRFACAAGCNSNASCGLDQRCNATTHQCEGPTVGSVRICQGTSACGSCEVCDALKGECTSARSGLTGFPYCQPCSSPSECPGGTCVALPSGATVCARTCGNVGQECPQGFTCLMLNAGGQACVPADRSCTGKCP